jgi:hypothetical protein
MGMTKNTAKRSSDGFLDGSLDGQAMLLPTVDGLTQVSIDYAPTHPCTPTIGDPLSWLRGFE